MPNTELVNPNNFPNLSGMGRVKNFNGSSGAAVGVYAVDEMAITEQWKIMGGLPYDLFDVDFRNHFAAQELSRTDEALSARAAPVSLPTKTQTYHFSYGTSFDPPRRPLTLSLNNAGTEPEKNETRVRSAGRRLRGRPRRAVASEAPAAMGTRQEVSAD